MIFVHPQKIEAMVAMIFWDGLDAFHFFVQVSEKSNCSPTVADQMALYNMIDLGNDGR